MSLVPSRCISITTATKNFQFWMKVSVVMSLVSAMSRVLAESDFVTCPLSSALFYHKHCTGCLQPTVTKENVLCPGRGNDFTVCQAVSVGTRRNVKKGALYLKTRNINTVTIQRPPFSQVIEGQDGVKSYRGIIFEFLTTMEIKYNFSMRIFTTPDGNFGAIGKNKKWDGMVGIVLRKEAEIGAGSFSITLDRAQAVQFTVAIAQDPTAILIPAPTEGSKLKQLIKPLSPEVWLGLGVSVLVIIPTFYAIHVWTLMIRWNKITKRSTFAQVMTKLALYITGSLTQQSVTSPLAGTTRVLLSIWWMMAFVMANTYVAFLVSLLSVPELQDSINTLEELCNQRKLQWTFRIGTAHYPLFKSETSSGIFKRIGEGVRDEDLVKTDFAGMEKVLTGNWAFLKERSFMDVALDYDFNRYKKCRLTLAKEEFFAVGAGLIVQKGSPFLGLLDYEISTSISTGLMEKWRDLHWPKKLHCVNADKYILSTQPTLRKLGLNEVQAAYFVLCCGLLLAVLVFTMEYIFSRSNVNVAMKSGIRTKFSEKKSKLIYLK